nr:thioesterase family protein [Dietzia sp. DQ11-38-2]
MHEATVGLAGTFGPTQHRAGHRVNPPGDTTIAGALGGDRSDVRALFGFGGVHGGLLAAALLRAARGPGPSDRLPVETTTYFLRPVLAMPDLERLAVREGGRTTITSASATVDGTLAATSTTVSSTAREPSTPVVSTVAPDITPLDLTERFVIPPEFVPISTKMEIRPATPGLPYSGATVPELCAWIRLTESVHDPFERILILADALAPSYAAILTDLRMAPSVRMTVRFTPAVARLPFDWVLVRAATAEAGTDGWLGEHVTIWAPDGELLATSTQLRAIR